MVELAILSEDESSSDLYCPPCPHPPDPWPSGVNWPDDPDYPHVSHDQLCRRSTCTFCPAAGCVWTSGFCHLGGWKKKSLEQGPSLDPLVWSKLPRELLDSVFARLSTDGIGRTRALSKEWNLVMSSSSTVTKECGEFQPNLCALIGFSSATKTCWVRAYDDETSMWHAFSIESIPKVYASAIVACDAGLACCVPCRGSEDSSPQDVTVQPILICNPLTREWRQLPLQQIVLDQPFMVELRVDRKSGSYKVVLVGDTNDGWVAEVYDSKTKEWSILQSGKVLKERATEVIAVYDCCTRELNHYDGDDFPGRPVQDVLVAEGWEMAGLAIHASDLYLLHYWEGKECTLYNVSIHKEGHWGFDSNGLSECDRAPETFEFELNEVCLPMSLLVCKNFVLALGEVGDDPKVFYLKLHNTKTGNWKDKFRSFTVTCDGQLHSVSSEDMYTASFSELRWDACP